MEDRQPLLSQGSRPEEQKEVESLGDLEDGDPIKLLQDGEDETKVRLRHVPIHEIRYVNIAKNKYFATRQEAFRGEAREENAKLAGDMTGAPFMRMSLSEVALSHTHYINQTSRPRSPVDIDSSWQTIARDTMIALCGTIPGIGCVCVIYLIASYFVRNWHLLAPQRERNFTYWWIHFIVVFNLIVVTFNPAALLQTYAEHYHSLSDAARDEKQDTQKVVQDVIDTVQFEGIKNLCSICSILIFSMLSMNYISLSADVSCYKAEAESKLRGRAKDTLDYLKQCFDDVFEPGEPPTNLKHSSFEDDIGWGIWFPLFVSGLVMCGGLFGMWYGIISGNHDLGGARQSALGVLLTLFGILSTSRNWYSLLRFLTRAKTKVHRNTKQLLLFSALVRTRHLRSFDNRRRDTIRTALESLFKEALNKALVKELRGAGLNDEEVEQHKDKCALDLKDSADMRSFRLTELLQMVMHRDKRLKDWSKASEEAAKRLLSKPQEVVAELNGLTRHEDNKSLDELRNNVFSEDTDFANHASISFDLGKFDDVCCWWELRKYMRIDFIDESALMEHCSVVTLLLMVSFLSFGILDFTIHKDVISEMRHVAESGNALEAFVQIQKLSGLIVVSNCVISLSILFYYMIEECIGINQVLESDVSMLLTQLADVQLVSDQRRSTNSITSDADPDRRSVAPLLDTLIANVRDNDQRILLFGLPVTAQVRNVLVTSLCTALLKYAWEAISPLLQSGDAEKLAEGMERLFKPSG